MQDNGQFEARQQSSRRGPRFSLASGAKPLPGYTIKRGVGVGGFGEVYYATSDAGKEVALKRIQRNLEVELRGVRQCLNLKHVNLVSLYDIKYDEDDQAWVVMEYISGESLQDAIERNPNGMPLDLVHFWFDGIASGVAHLHDCGIVHRDLKPANIFVDNGTVKIGDYGLSKFISCSRRSGQTQSVGTFHYMAPEIGQGRYGKEIDVYALGIMLYEMLTGRVPYDGESSQEIIMKHLTAKPDVSDIQSPYRQVIEEALAKDPAARKSSVAAMRSIVIPGVAALPKERPAVVGYAVHQQPVPPEPMGGTETAQVTGAAVPVKAPIPEEPIAAAFRTAWNDISTAWNHSQLGSTTKLLILLATIPLLIFNARWLVPYGACILVSYGVYVVIRSMVLHNSRKTVRSPGKSSVAAVSPSPDNLAGGNIVLAEPVGPRKCIPRQQRHAKRAKPKPWLLEKRMLRSYLGEKTSQANRLELVGSMLLAAMVSVVVALIAFMVRGLEGDHGVRAIAEFAWVGMVSTVAAWGVLITSKWWEASDGDKIRRRFTLLVTGMTVGLLAWGLAHFLELPLQYFGPLEDGLAVDEAPNAFYDRNAVPYLPAFVAFFGGLFLLLRWWRQADPIRSARLGIWRTAVCLLGALLVQAFVPLSYGFLIAVTTALAVQISAPYVDSDERKLICERTTV